MKEKVSMPTCPMAAMCKGMMERRRSGIWMILPGLLFIALGVAIILYPKILLWLVAIILIAMGVGMLMMANFMRDIGKRMEHS
jgi:uncharacterized membrane protein HdeD (DUF308 family)